MKFNKPLLTIISIILVACVGAGGAAADVIIDYPVRSSDSSNCNGFYFSDFTQNLQTAGKFTSPVDAEVDHVVWFGGYLNGTGGGTIDFVIRVFEQGGGAHPMNVPLHEFTVTATGTMTTFLATSSNCTGGLIPVFRYEAALPAFDITAGTPLWLSIVEDTPSLVWYQPPSVVNLGSLSNVRRFTDSHAWRDTGPSPPAFVLQGTISPVAVQGETWANIKGAYRSAP